MDEQLARLNRIYPNSKFVKIDPYCAAVFEGRDYDSQFDKKETSTRWKSSPLDYAAAAQAAEEGYRIGWVVPQGFVIVDIDNKDHSESQERVEKLLKKFEVKYSYNYTSKGIHILFKDPTESIKSVTRVKCALNIQIDTRANESGYVVLPTNDPHRCWGEWNDFVEDIPYFMKPLQADATPSFIGMQEGDGRNNALFKWRTTLEKTHRLSDKEVEKSIRIINENIFDTPMQNNELFKTVLRTIDKEADAKSDRGNKLNEIAEEIVGKYDFISYYDRFYKFNGVYYESIEELELEQIIHLEVDKNLSKSQRKEIIEFIKVKTQIKEEDFDKEWYKIACGNGILNLVTATVEQPNKSEYNTVAIPWNYNPSCEYSPRIDQFMKELCNGDAIKIQFLYQIAGYCLLKSNVFAKFVIFRGEGGTGKSTFMSLLHKLVGGDRNCAHVSLAQMDKDYYLATLVSKLLNIDDDVVDGKALEDTGRFKSVTSGNKIQARAIYREPISFTPYCTCVFACNNLPRIMDNTSGLYRRMILIELNNKIKEPDPLFLNKITTTDMEYFLFKAVEGITLALEEGKFRISQSEEELLALFKRRQSPLNEWIYDSEISLGDVANKDCLSLFKEYLAWCELNGYTKTLAMFSFRESICSIYDVELDRISVEGSPVGKLAFIVRGDRDLSYKPF